MKKRLSLVLTILLLCSATQWYSNTLAETTQPDIALSMQDLPFEIGTSIGGGDFTGKAYLRNMIQNEAIYNFPQTNLVTFEPGARSGWHSHGGMVVIAVGGVGYYQEEGKPAQILRAGDIVEIPEGVVHWHGAAKDSWFSQMVIYDSHYHGTSGLHSMSGPVTDAWYESLETVEMPRPAGVADERFLFPRAAHAMNMSVFSGPVYVSDLVEAENPAGAPALHYVAFEPGTINNWHTHEGGQILIATDGIGYHQIEGQEVEALYPGDVVYCPPGVKHWHGAAANTSFAHITANTNPELQGVEWFDRISEEAYLELPEE